MGLTALLKSDESASFARASGVAFTAVDVSAGIAMHGGGLSTAHGTNGAPVAALTVPLLVGKFFVVVGLYWIFELFEHCCFACWDPVSCMSDRGEGLRTK